MGEESQKRSPSVFSNGSFKNLTIPYQPAKQMISPGADALQSQFNSTLAHGKTVAEAKNYRQYKKMNNANPELSRSEFRDQKGLSGAGSLGESLSFETGNAIMDAATGLIPDKGKNTAFKEQQQIGNALMKINPVVGGIYKAASIVGELTGTNVSKMSGDQATAAGINNTTRLLNNAAAFIPGVGLRGGTINAEKSHLIDEMSGAYGGSVSDINTAGSMAGQNYLFGKNKADQFIADMNATNKIMTNINQTNTLRKQSDYGFDIAQQNLNRYAGTNYMDMRMGRSGLKLDSLAEIRTMLANRHSETKEIEKFANGGVLEGTNLIPSGKLHKELHHIEDSDSELAENLTRKGIPVVALSEGGEIEQVAEIEHSEITLSKALTDKLEELRKDGSEEAMIEAGKILVEEIMFNTDDKIGIINENDSVNNK